MLKVAMVLASFLVLACAGPALAAELVPQWTGIGKLPKAERALARRVVAEKTGDDQDSDSDEMNKFVRNEARGGYLSPGTGGGLFLVRMPSFSNCGEITLSIFGPPGQSGKRPVLMDQECLSGVRFVVSAKGDLPDIIATIGEFADLIYRWNGTKWRAEETIEGPALRQPANGNGRNLRTLAGMHDLLSALQATGIRARLKTGLGVHYPILLRNLSVRGPLVFNDGCLIAEGLAPHSGGSEEAVLAICSNGALYVALLTNDSVLVHSPVSGMVGLPAAMRPTIEHWSDGRPTRWIGAK
ncbi:MAG: hypothetical protein HQL42_12155 [Alphaproteobacteria bacterium]|nr:hypothetical protein [Alphaproteobacteria bacterium]